MADSIIVGRWEGPNALAAVSSVGALINLILNVFMGLAVGASVDLVEEDALPFQSDYCDCVIEYVAMRLSMIDEFDQNVEAQLLGEIRSHVKSKLNDYVPQDHVVRPYYR